jgi:hypothetical protein
MQAAMQRVWIQLTSDRRRLGVLLGAVLVGALLWARIIIVAKPPRTAIADEAAANAQDESQNRAGRRGRDNQREVAAPVVLALSPPRDPFRINPQFFPNPTETTADGEDEAKSVSTPAEDAQRDAERTRFILGAAGRLKLEAVMKGAQLAVIDGRMTRVGDRIVVPKDALEFVLIEVGERVVILECEARHIELRMSDTIGDNR